MLPNVFKAAIIVLFYTVYFIFMFTYKYNIIMIERKKIFKLWTSWQILCLESLYLLKFFLLPSPNPP